MINKSKMVFYAPSVFLRQNLLFDIIYNKRLGTNYAKVRSEILVLKFYIYHMCDLVFFCLFNVKCQKKAGHIKGFY